MQLILEIPDRLIGDLWDNLEWNSDSMFVPDVQREQVLVTSFSGNKRGREDEEGRAAL